MNSKFRLITLPALLCLLLALSLHFVTTSSAQESPAPEAPPAVAPTGETPAAPETPAEPETPTLPETPAVPAGTEELVAPADPAAVTGTEPLRRLDDITPVPAPAVVTTDAGEGQVEAEAPARKTRKVRRQYDSAGEFPLGDHTVATGQTVREVVSIMGSSLVEGEVAGEAVSIYGHTTVNGSTGSEAVSVLGNTTVNGSVGGEAVAVLGNVVVNGRVAGEAVAVLGNVMVNGQVDGEVVSVLGNVVLGPKAEVKGDLVVVGGRLERDPGAVVKGGVQQISFLGRGANVDWLITWVQRCLLLGRPLAFGEHLGWAWLIAISVFAFYVLLALLFPRAFEKCAETLEQRPGYSLLAVLLTVLITPVLIVLLAITGIGVILIPFVAAGLFFAGIFGKAVMHAWLGRRITRYFGPGPMTHVASATLIGSVLVLLLYTVPFLGFFTFKVLDIIGLGVVVYTLILTLRREKPVAPPPVAGMSAAAGIMPVAPVSVVAPPIMPFIAADSAGELRSPARSEPSLPLVVGATLPRAGFWIRIAASALDAILIGMLCGFLSSIWDGFGGAFPLWFVIYSVVLWALKGTTIGGIVCGLKVVRLDDRKLDWTVAVVRGLGGFLSLFVAGLGFIWVAFDSERQSWHDKIAGTTIVRVPKGVSLI